MDNFTHSLTGWVLGQTGLKQKSRKGLAALILGANLPDIDVFFGWVPWEPLATHRGFTHGLVGGVLLLPPVLALLLWLLDKWQLKRGVHFKSGLPMNVKWLVVLSYIGAISHPLLDWQNTYAVQLLSPFSNIWFHNDALFIIDVWVWSGLAFAIWLSRRREKSAQGNWRKPAILAVSIGLLYISGNSMLSSTAKRSLEYHAPYANPDAVFASPKPVAFYERNMVWRENHMITYGEYNPLKDGLQLATLSKPEPTNTADPYVQRAMTANADIIDFLNWSVLPMAQVSRDDCEVTVVFNDARFGQRSMPAWLRGDENADKGKKPETDRFARTVVLPLYEVASARNLVTCKG